MEDSPNPGKALVDEPMEHLADLRSSHLHQVSKSESWAGFPQHLAKLLICLLDAVLVQVRPERIARYDRLTLERILPQVYAPK